MFNIFSELRDEIKRRVNRPDLDNEYIKRIVNEAIAYVDRLNLWFFQEEIISINVGGGNYILDYDVLTAKIKSIKKIYYNKPGKPNLFLSLLPVSSKDEAIMLIGDASASNEVPQINNELFGGFYYLEAGKIKTYPPILVSVDTIFLNVFKYIELIVHDSQTNYLIKNYPFLLINYAIMIIYKDLEVYDVAEEYKKLFEEELKALYFANMSVYKEVNPNELFRITTENNQ